MAFRDIDFQGKKVLVRVDFNVPLSPDNQITDDTRMVKALPTIKAIVDGGGAVILMSHLGRPQKKRTAEGAIDVAKFSLRALIQHLSDLTATNVLFAEDCVGQPAQALAESLRPGDILLLENTRFHQEEESGDRDFARQLAELGDIYINDAFGTAHRAHASTTIVAEFFESDAKAFGLLMQAELDNATRVVDAPGRPLLAILGGAKVSDKIGLLSKLIEFADDIIVGGAMAFTFIKAQGGNVGKSLVEEDKLDLASEILSNAREKGTSVHLPSDAVAADHFAADAVRRIVPSTNIADGWMGLDIGPESLEAFSKVIQTSATILWNGPMGVFEMEPFSKGTLGIATAVAERTRSGAFSLVGGGDSVAAVNQSSMADDISFISTGGGAMLEFLEGKTLPGVAAIENQV